MTSALSSYVYLFLAARRRTQTARVSPRRGSSRKADFSVAQGILPPKSGCGSAVSTPSSARRSAAMCPSSVPQQPPKYPTPAAANSTRARGELVRRAVVLGAPVHDAGQPGVGLGQQRDLRPGAQPLYLREYVARDRPSSFSRRRPRPCLHHDQRRRGIRARERASVLVAGEGHDGGLAADAAHGQQRRAGFGQGHHRLDYEQVDARLLQRGSLLGVDVEKLFKARCAERGEETAPWGRCPRATSARPAGGFPRYSRQAEVELAHAVEYASRLELDAVRAEGGRCRSPGCRRPRSDAVCPASASGCSSTQASAQPPPVKPRFCSSVPVAPSSIVGKL